MDNFEQLLRDADPRAQKNTGSALPLDLGEPGPEFAQQPILRVPKPRRSWRQLALGALATAAAVAAVILWAPWNAPVPVPSPAPPASENTLVPSPSTSDTTAPTPTAQSLDLPNDLFPAYSGAHFANDAPCRALALPKVLVADATGETTNPKIAAKAFALIGCLEGFAAFTPADDYRAESSGDDVSLGMLIVKWNPRNQTWVSSPSSVDGQGVEIQQEYLSWPLLRGYPDESDKSPIQRMNQAIKNLKIPASIVTELFGPNVPSWMEEGNDAKNIAYGNTLLEVTHPSWTQLERVYDSNGKALDEVTGDPRDAATYQLQYFDSHGKSVFNLGIFNDTSAGQGSETECNDPAATYTLVGLNPSGVVIDEGALSVGLITETDRFGTVRSMVSLVLANSALEGKLCDLPRAFHHDGKMVQSDAWNGQLGFTDAAERDAYLESSEYRRAIIVAASLSL